jgi:hypothetical protein
VISNPRGLSQIQRGVVQALRCLGITKRRKRCRRTSVRVLCRDHVWQPIAFTISVVSVLVLFTDFNSSVVQPLWQSVSPPAPALKGEAKCVDQVKKSEAPPANNFVALWYCETQFANFWKSTPEMLPNNKELLLKQFAAFDPRLNERPNIPTAEATFGENARDAFGLARIFEKFPDYSSRFAVVIGQVRSINKYTSGPTWSDWVVQLGSVQSDGTLIYARFSVPLGWVPPEGCKVGMIVGVPIAIGNGQELGGLRSYQIIYEMATGFDCVAT